MLSVALPKGRLGDKVYALMANAGYTCKEMTEDSRKLVFENEESGGRASGSFGQAVTRIRGERTPGVLRTIRIALSFGGIFRGFGFYNILLQCARIWLPREAGG